MQVAKMQYALWDKTTCEMFELNHSAIFQCYRPTCFFALFFCLEQESCKILPLSFFQKIRCTYSYNFDKRQNSFGSLDGSFCIKLGVWLVLGEVTYIWIWNLDISSENKTIFFEKLVLMVYHLKIVSKEVWVLCLYRAPLQFVLIHVNILLTYFWLQFN